MIRIQPLLERLPEDERAKIASHHGLARDAASVDIARHLVTSRVLLNGLKNELRPVTNLIERLAAFGAEAEADSDLRGDVTPTRLEATHGKGLVFLQPSAAEPSRMALPLEYLLMREIKRPAQTDLIAGLRTLTVDQARIMARMLDVEDRRSVPLLLGDLYDALVASVASESLPADQQEALDAILQKGGIVDAGSHHRDHALVADPHARGPFTTADLFGTRGARGRPTAMQMLVRRGRVFAQTDRDQPNGSIVKLFVPSEVAEPLAASWAARHDESVRETIDAWRLDDDPATVKKRPDDIVGDLRAFALGVATLGCRYAEAGHLRRVDTDAFQQRRAIDAADQARLAELGYRLGVFRIDERRLVVDDGAEARLDETPAAQVDAIRRAIVEEAGLADPLPARFRRWILGAMARHDGVWLRLAGVRALLDGDREFQRSVAANDLESSTIDAAVATALDELRSWGWFDLGYDGDRLVCARYRAPEADAAWPEIPSRPLTIPPNRDVIVPAAAPFHLLQTIGQFAEPQRFDVAVVYSISDRSLLRGTTRGYPPEQVVPYLTAHCVHPIPESIDQCVNDVIEREGEVSVMPATSVLVFRDPAVSDAAKRHPDLGHLFGCEIARGVYVPPVDTPLEIVQEALRKHGFYATPRTAAAE